jgi:hypothetical protein
VRGSANFITLGVHTRPPTEQESLFVEAKPIPEQWQDLGDRALERAIKIGFTVRRLMDELELPWVPGA